MKKTFVNTREKRRENILERVPEKKPNPMKDKKYSKWNDFNTGNIK